MSSECPRAVAAYSVLSVCTARTRTYALLRSGEIPVIRVGRAVRVPRDGLCRWIDEHSTPVGQMSAGNGFGSR